MRINLLFHPIELRLLKCGSRTPRKPPGFFLCFWYRLEEHITLKNLTALQKPFTWDVFKNVHSV
jgi:hypothetical protein